MKIGSAFPSKYLKAADLNERAWVLTMDKIQVETVGQGNRQEDRPVLYFLKTEKGLVLNKTNANTISKLYGDETDGWEGHQVELFPAMVDFAGDTVEAIRVRAPKVNKGVAPAKPAPEPQPPSDLDDSIPF